ncbi:MAG: type II CAAX endopeptidase family protein [Bacteroidaceae bacterium]|nr:CPBP family intramembrane metalloprotease [Bacteroidaceae bacterium]
MKKSIILVLVYFFIQLVSSFLSMAVCYLYLYVTHQDLSTAGAKSIVPALVLSILIMGFYMWKKGWISTEKERWSIVSPRFLFVSLALAASAIWLLDVLMSYISLPDLLKSSFDVIQSGWIGILCVAVLGPIVEELLFRGAITSRLLRRYSPLRAILFSALIFGVFHLNPAQIPGAFFIGLILAWIFYQSGSLIPGMLIHIFNNSLSVYLDAKYPKMDNLTDLMSTSDIRLCSLMAVIVFILMFYWLRRLKSPKVWLNENKQA